MVESVYLTLALVVVVTLIGAAGIFVGLFVGKAK